MSNINNLLQKYRYILLCIFFIVAYLLPLNSRMLSMPDESRYAEISREMLQTGDWVVPHLLGLNYFEKPVAGYWLNNISQILFGETPFAVRFATAASTAFMALLLFWFSLRLFHSHKKAFATAACYLSCIEVYSIGTYSVLDGMFTLWFNLGLITFYCSLQTDNLQKKIAGYALMGAVTGFAFLTKGFIGLLLPAIIAFPYLVYRRQLRELRYLWVAILSLLIVSLPWAILVHLRAPDYWHYFFWEEHIKRFASADAQHKAPLYFYLPVLILGSLPWVGIVPSALRQAWLNISLRPVVWFLIFWAVMPFIFFSISKGKLPTYILSCFAPLAIFLGFGLVELIEKKQWRAIRLNSGVNILFGSLLSLVIGLVGAGILGHNTLYEASEKIALSCAMSIFIFWAAMGLLSYWRPMHTLWFTTLSPLALAILLGSAMPLSTIYSKQPEAFIKEHSALLKQAPFVLSNDPGLALSLAWELKRTDIRLYDSRGELAYGLKESALVDKFINASDFKTWLSRVRAQGDVIVLAHHDVGDIPVLTPSPDEIFSKQHLTLFYYKAMAANVPHE